MTPAVPGRTSSAFTYTSYANGVRTKKSVMGTSPSAGIAKSTGMSITMSGSPCVHPSAAFGTGGRLAVSPRGAPESTHLAIVSISVALRLRSSLNRPYRGSAPHGGISRLATFARIDFAQGRASSYDTSDIGAISPGRWHPTQLV